MPAEVESPRPSSLVVRAVLGLLQVYRLVLRPLIGPACRFAPSCSDFTSEALREHGARRGAWLAIRRVLRCHPWNPGGWDPVPRPYGE